MGVAHGDVSFELIAPPANAARVCVIDSGIQEGHRLLESAIDSQASRCFIPGQGERDVADCVTPNGHGTGVAGAVLYPRGIPTEGTYQLVAWIQNARVLEEDNYIGSTVIVPEDEDTPIRSTVNIPIDVKPADYLTEVVDFYTNSTPKTKIFNHSINKGRTEKLTRMSAWGAKMDELSHARDILFIQSAGNSSDQSLQNLLQKIYDAEAVLPGNWTETDHFFEPEFRVAAPAQSLHALTVGSIGEKVYTDLDIRSFCSEEFHPSAFSRIGYAEPWSQIKPEVVEIGGDYGHSRHPPFIITKDEKTGTEILNSTAHGASAYSGDGVGTSFSAPKVAHIASHLQNLYPDSSPQLYRALIVHSVRWPQWAERMVSLDSGKTDRVLKLVGYGIPSLERASINSLHRITLITLEAREIRNKEYDLESVLKESNKGNCER